MFRHRKFKPLMFTPVDIDVEVQNSQLDEDGVQHVSFANVSAKSVVDSMPLCSEVTIAQQLMAGSLNPVNLQDFTVDNLDNDSASLIIDSLNNDTNENT